MLILKCQLRYAFKQHSLGSVYCLYIFINICMCITITAKEKEFMDSRGSKEGTWEEMKEGVMI